jgi:hypothetical protein
MNKLLSFHNDPAIKDKYLKRLQLHFDLDEIEKGYYWENGKVCAVGCTVHSGQHKAYEKELGIPIILAKLEDRIFEGLPNSSAKHFPIDFLTAIPVGVDLSNVWKEFIIWVLTDYQHGVVTRTKNEAVQGIAREVSAALRESLTTDLTVELWDSLRRRARSVGAYAAYAYAAYPARSSHYQVMADKLLQLLRDAA